MGTLDELIARVQGLPPEQQSVLYKEAHAQTAHMKWVPNAGPQSEAYFSKADVLLYGGEPGGGKGVRPEEPVLTPFGWKPIGELGIGSLICAPDGTATKIIGYFRRGVQPLFKITFHDGAEVVCDADHLWLGWGARGQRKINNAITCGEAGAKKWTTADIYRHYSGGGERIAIPVLSAPACFNVAGGLVGKGNFVGRPIPPYVLGVLLGDGCITQRGTAAFSSADPEIAARVASEMNSTLGCSTGDGKCPAYRIPGALITHHLDDLKLWGKRAETKSIPRQYLLAPVAERWALLQGLMDTDGWADEDGDSYFCSVSRQLIDDVRHLARSLGGIVTMREKMPTYTHKGEKRIGQKAYTLRIKMADSSQLFHLERKRRRCEAKVPLNLGRWIEGIEPAGEGETICITVEHPSSLFIVHDFIVTHNSQLLLGLAHNEHKRSLIMRRQYGDLDRIIEDCLKIHGSRDGFNGSPPPKLRISPTQIIDFAAAHRVGDEQGQMGKGRDLLGIDEATHFAKSQIRFLMGWNRSDDPNQRVRTVLATNPPLSAEGLWVIEMFAPWLDPTYYHPAKPGELRWVVSDDDGNDKWVEEPGEYEVTVAGKPKMVLATSRTYIPASVKDNPYYVASGYEQQLDGMPEPFRSLLMGGFRTAFQDQANQIIPTKWVELAQQRWTPQPPRGVPMCAIGVDASGGGLDPMVLAPRYDGWFAPLIEVPGKEIPIERAGAYCSGVVVSHRRDRALVVLDMGGGYGGPMYEHLTGNHVEVKAYKGAEGSTRRTVDGKLRFVNKRSAALWQLREALDPGQPGGSPVALPPRPRLLSDLTAPTFEVTPNGIKAEPKERVMERLGRSTNEGDAVMMSWFEGERALTNAMDWMDLNHTKHGLQKAPQVVTSSRTPLSAGRQPLSARRRT